MSVKSGLNPLMAVILIVPRRYFLVFGCSFFSVSVFMSFNPYWASCDDCIP